MEAVQGPGALLNEILPPLREHPERDLVPLPIHLAQALRVQRGEGDVEGVQLVVLAPVADRERPDADGGLGGDVGYPLAAGNEALREQAAHAAGALHGPAALGEALRPARQRPQAGPVGGKGGVLE